MAKFERANQSAFTVTVFAAIGDYKEGGILKNEMDIADYLRLVCQAADVTLTLDDDQIIAIAKSVPKEGMSLADWEIEVCSVLESRNKPNDRSPRDALPDTRSPTDIQVSSMSVAKLIGEMFDANATFRERMQTAAYAAEVVKASPLNLLLSIFELYGLTVDNEGDVKGIEHSKMFDAMPHPKATITKDSEYWKKNGKVLKEDLNRFAEYPQTVGKDVLKYDWYADMFDRTTIGKAIDAEVKQWTLARSAKGKTPSGRYADKLQDEVVNKLALWKLRQSTGIKFLKMAVEACYQWRDILSLLHGKIGVVLGMEGEGDKAKVSEGFVTIIVHTIGSKVAQSQALTISGFNNLDVEAAQEKGGTLRNLLDSTKTGARDTEDSGLWDEGEIKVAGVLDNLPQLADWFAIPANLGDLMAKADAKDKATRERTEEAENTILAGMKWYHAMSRFAAKYAAIAMDIETARLAEHRAASEKVQEKIKSVA